MVKSLALFFTAIVLMLAAVLSVMRARRVEQLAKVNKRLEQVSFLVDVDAFSKRPAPSITDALSRWLRRVGFGISPATALSIMLLVILCGLGIKQMWGTLAALMWWALVGTVAVFIPQIRYRQKLNKLISQVPLFIDQIIRGLVTGRNVEGALKLASEDIQDPLREVMQRVQNNVELGADLGEAMRDMAHFYELKELHMLALAIHTSRVYGGSPREMLESIVNLIRQREQMQRELRAMTGETRFSAWVMGLLPSLIACYMVWINPDYVAGMWNDETGRNLLLVSLSMQILGGLVLWRMVKSV
jgi:tight adherence protein B